MSYVSNVVRNQATTEYGKFVEIQNDSRFPPVSVVRYEYADSTEAFNWPLSTTPLSSVDIYPKYAVLTYDISEAQTNGSPFGDNSSTDAFGRLRVSQPKTLLDSKVFYDKTSFYFDEVLSGTATSTFSAYDSCIVMKTAAKNDFVISQTRQRFNYQPGKSLQYIFTGNFKPETNIIKRVGAFQSLSAEPFHPSDGIWLEVNQYGPIFRIEKTQGTPHTNYAPQSAWNIDKLDGTGASGFTLDFNKNQIFAIDYEWLSLGRVRFGFYINGKLYYAHQDNHLNELEAPYMTYANQPVRYEIRQTGTGSGTMKQICSTVITEGGEEGVGRLVSKGLSAAIGVGDDNYYLLVASRLSPGKENIAASIKEIDILNTNNTNSIYKIIYNPTFSSNLIWYNVNSSGLQVSYGDGTIYASNLGYELATNYCSGNSKGTSSQTEIPGLLATLGCSISGTPDVIAIVGRSFTATNANMVASIISVVRG